jgi:hypothetical protein
MTQPDHIERENGVHLARVNLASLGIGIGVLMTVFSCLGIAWNAGKLTLLMSMAAALIVLLLTRRVFKELAIEVPRFWLFFLAPLLLIPSIVAFSYPYSWDEVAYGAALPRDYAKAGMFYYNADYGPYSAFPGNYEALTTAALLLFHSVVPIKLLNLILTAGLALAAVQMYNMLGFDRRFSAIAGTAVLSAGALILFSVVVKNDIANAFFQSLAILAFIAYTKEPELKFLLLSGAFLGIALGIKYSSLQFAVCMFVCVALTMLRMPRNRADVARQLTQFTLVIAVASSPWYLRNLIVFSNPFFPFFCEVLRAPGNFGQEHVAITKEMFNGIARFSLQQGKLSDFYRVTLNQFGHLPVLLALPGLVLAITRRRSNALLFVSALFASYLLMTIFGGYWEPRYFAVLLILSSVLGTICIAVTATLVVPLFRVGLPRLKRWTEVATVVLGVAVLARHSLLVQWYGLGAVAASVLRGDSVDSFGTRYIHFWDVAQWINRNLSDSDRIGMGINVQPFYYVDRKYFHIHPMSEKGNLQAARTDDDFMKAFKSLDLTMLAINEWWPESVYPIQANPHMYGFMKRLYSAIASLEAAGRIVPVAHLGEVTVFTINR